MAIIGDGYSSVVNQRPMFLIVMRISIVYLFFVQACPVRISIVPFVGVCRWPRSTATATAIGPAETECTGPFASCCTNNKGRRTLLNPEGSEERRTQTGKGRAALTCRQQTETTASFFSDPNLATPRYRRWLPRCLASMLRLPGPPLVTAFGCRAGGGQERQQLFGLAPIRVHSVPHGARRDKNIVSTIITSGYPFRAHGVYNPI